MTDHYESTDGFVVVAPGISARTRTRVTAEDVEGLDVEFEVVAEPMTNEGIGRLLVQRMQVSRRPGGPPVSSELIRRIPVKQLAFRFVKEWLHSYDSDDGSSPGHSSQFTPERLAHYRASGPTIETLKRVAFIYRFGLLMADAPTQWVADTFGVPRSTAGRWVALARERGCLGAAEGAGRAGG